MALKQYFILFAFVACSLFAVEWAQGALPQQIQVNLFETQPKLQQILLTGPFRFADSRAQSVPAGTYRLTLNQNRVILSQDGASAVPVYKGARLKLQAVSPQGLGVRINGQPLRHYRGKLQIQVNTQQQALHVENIVSPQDYVAGVVASETPPHWPLEALKAQAVLTQTRLARYHPGDTLGDSTQQESYRGEALHRPEVRQAVRAVWGQVLTFHQQPIEPFYHAACGGKTQIAKRYFSQKAPGKAYLSSVVCPYCKASPFWKSHESLIPYKPFEAVFGPGTPKVIQQDTTQRPLWLQWPNEKKMSGYTFWLKLGQHFGWDKAPGSRYQILSSPAGIRIRSTGAGHGVGLCQWGAAELAKTGQSYRQILQFYFPKTELH